MPMSAIQRRRYPKNWPEISDDIRFGRAHGRCEFVDEEGKRCQARHGEHHPLTGAVVVLTVAHLDHCPENCDPDNLRAGCQRCHNRHDRMHRNASRRSWFIKPLELFTHD